MLCKPTYLSKNNRIYRQYFVNIKNATKGKAVDCGGIYILFHYMLIGNTNFIKILIYKIVDTDYSLL